MDINKILESAHSGWRWIVLVLLIAAIVKMHLGWKGKKAFTAGDKKLALFAMISFHIQYLMGLVLYFISQKVQFVEGFMGVKSLRFYAVEHIAIMTIAMILITVGHSKSKKKAEDTARFKTLAIFYTIAFLLVLLGIPWPFREGLQGGWF